MTTFLNENSSECREIQSLLSEYTDNTLSARQVWAVEKHVAGCGACARQMRQTMATVQLLRAAPRRDTSDTFMASLHARLDTVDPESKTARSILGTIRDWLSGGGSPALRGRAPVLSLWVACAALAALIAVNRPVVEPASVVAPSSASSEGVHVSVAASASSPFSDPAADNLEFRSDTQRIGPRSF